MTTADRYRVIVDGEPSEYSWETIEGAVREAAKVAEERPGIEVRIQRPDVLVRPGRQAR
jgi:hypothetical protein